MQTPAPDKSPQENSSSNNHGGHATVSGQLSVPAGVALVGTPAASPAPTVVPPQSAGLARVKSPDCRRLQKASSSAEDSSFSKTSSSTSLDQVVSAEGVCAVHFVDAFTVKNDFNSLNACLVVGTSLGSIIFIAINMPDRGDPRNEEPVVVRHLLVKTSN